MENKPKKGRPETRLQLWAENWLHGSTRVEMNHEKRAIWIDFLALASMHRGRIIVPAKVVNRTPKPNFILVASEFLASEALIEECFQLFVSNGKVSVRYDSVERKFILVVAKWEQYQDKYLHYRPEKSEKKQPETVVAISQDNAYLNRSERKGKDRKGKEGGEKPKTAPQINLDKISYELHPQIVSYRTSISKYEEQLEKKDLAEDERKYIESHLEKTKKELNRLTEAITGEK